MGPGWHRDLVRDHCARWHLCACLELHLMRVGKPFFFCRACERLLAEAEDGDVAVDEEALAAVVQAALQVGVERHLPARMPLKFDDRAHEVGLHAPHKGMGIAGGSAGTGHSWKLQPPSPWRPCPARHIGRRHPAGLGTHHLRTPSVQINYTCLIHCLDFGSSYNDMLLQKMGRTSRECVEFGLMSLHLDGRNMDARYLSNFSKQNVCLGGRWCVWGGRGVNISGTPPHLVAPRTATTNADSQAPRCVAWRGWLEHAPAVFHAGVLVLWRGRDRGGGSPAGHHADQGGEEAVPGQAYGVICRARAGAGWRDLGSPVQATGRCLQPVF